MRHRLVHRLAVALPAAGVVVLLAAASPAAAAPKGGAPPGNPHAEGAKGKPMPGKGGGNPHVTPAPPPSTTPAPTAIKAPSAPVARTAPVVSVTAGKQATASGGGGKPCNGCVGNANGRTPPGQKQNPGDGNHGHSCDGNKGIGKGNPAHVGCSPTTTPTTTTTTATTTPETPVVLGETLTRGGASPVVDTRVLGVTVARGSLATTGAEPVDLTVLALGLLAVGTALRRRGRQA